jgi:hypothetical protein
MEHEFDKFRSTSNDCRSEKKNLRKIGQDKKQQATISPTST